MPVITNHPKKRRPDGGYCSVFVANKWLLCKLLPLSLGLLYGFLFVVARRQLVQRWSVEDTDSSRMAVLQKQKYFQGREPPLRIRFTNTRRREEIDPNENIWDRSKLIPKWMKEYFAWHKQQRDLITPENWRNFSFLVMQCANFDSRCGGAADRLKPTPMMVLLAYQMKRLLLIHWQKPARLEEFLLPPQGGIDWRVPEFLIPRIGAVQNPIRVPMRMVRWMNATNTTINVRYQSFNGGSEYYDTNKPYGANFSQVYHEVWKVMFTPNPVVANMVQDLMELWELPPHEYASIHLRAHYGVEFEKRPHDFIEEWTPNAVNCASQLVPGGPFYFASDSTYAIALSKKYARRRRVAVAARTNGKEPFHLDKVPDWQQRQPSDYYDTFVDLYLLALGKCVTYSMGGFGSFALLINGNMGCTIRHHTAPGITHCEWNPTRPRLLTPPTAYQPLFIPPINGSATAVYSRSPQINSTITSTDDEFPVNYLPAVVWQNSTVLPQWMKEYLVWHKEQRARLTAENWKEFRYLVVQCCKTDPKCGGTADRLKPVIFLLFTAHLGKRILFIRWDTPRPLEEFLLPPIGGMDWRMPDFLVPRIGSVEYPITAGKRLLRSIQEYKTKLCLHARIQTNHGGAEYFDDVRPPGSPDYSEIFREAWRVLFTPVPRIAIQIQTFMNQTGLMPGQYTAAHARLLYTQSQRRRFRIRSLTQNALNCASMLYPGVPVFLASDSQEAKDDAWAYGVLKHAIIIARNQSTDEGPVHLDREDAWTYGGLKVARNVSSSIESRNHSSSSPEELVHMDWPDPTKEISRNTSAYDDTFVDLYLLSMSRCVAFNKGGFGHWGLLMSYNSSCGFRHQYNSKVYKCNWTEGNGQQLQQTTLQELPPLFVRPMPNR